MSFAAAVNKTRNVTRTENGMKTFDTTGNAIVDLFGVIGSSRGKDISALFERAYQEDRLLALRTLFWARDVRQGAGEREQFRNIVRHLEQLHPDELPQIVKLIPEFGRWDDLFALKTAEGRQLAYAQIREGLRAGNGLCAKWMPRKGPDALALREFLQLSPKVYRKVLVNLTKVVEQDMCAKQWSNINYSHVPSLAASRYQKAFTKHDGDRYKAYRDALVRGDKDVKINAGAIYPHQIVANIRKSWGDSTVSQAQWDALPNWCTDEMTIPVVDVSGSMSCPVGGNPNIQCVDVSVGLGLYLADKNRGPFKDVFLTFSSKSKLQVLKGDLRAKLKQMSTAQWDMSTNLHSAFEKILRVGKQNNLSDADMPKTVLILSDMQFDYCAKYDDSAIQMVRRKYEAAGYTMPRVVFWQLNARGDNSPVAFNEKGVALVSGFSPAIMRGILSARRFNPLDIVLETINSPRYQVIQ